MKRYRLALIVVSVIVAGFISPKSLLGQVTVVGESIHEQGARPGDLYTGTFLLKNESNRTQTVRLHPKRHPQVAGFSYVSRGEDSKSRSNTHWLTFSHSTVTIAPENTAAIHFEVAVPHKANGKPLAGTYWSAFEVRSMDAKPVNLSLGNMAPQAVEIATHIRESGSIDVAIGNVEMMEDYNNDLFVRADINNTGESTIRPVVWFEFYDAGGNLQDRIEGQAAQVFPGRVNIQYASVSHLQPATYEVLVLVDAGGENIYGAQYTVEWLGYGHVAQSGRSDIRQ